MTVETEGAAEAVTEDTAADLAAEFDQAPADQADADQPGEDAAAAADDQGEASQPKPKKTAQERINEQTAKQREAERRAEDAERRAEYWEAQATQPSPAKPTQQEQASGRPDPEKYDGGVYDPQFIEDLTDWKANTAVEAVLSKRETHNRRMSAVEAFDAKVAEAYPDGEPAGIIALRRAPVLAQSIVDLVTTSDIGPKLAEHLGDNPRELQRLSALAPHLQGRELARLETKLAAPAVAAPKTATDAPDVAPTLRGVGGRFAVSPDTTDFAAFEKLADQKR